jgi:hypothetical protein
MRSRIILFYNMILQDDQNENANCTPKFANSTLKGVEAHLCEWHPRARQGVCIKDMREL